jgi:hypothetical protein
MRDRGIKAEATKRRSDEATKGICIVCGSALTGLQRLYCTPNCRWRELGGRYRAAHREERNARDRAYNAAHREERNARKRAYNAAHREEVNAQWRAYYAAHREERNARNRAYYAAHREDIRARRRIKRALRGCITIDRACKHLASNWQGGRDVFCAICGAYAGWRRPCQIKRNKTGFRCARHKLRRLSKEVNHGDSEVRQAVA